MAVGQIGPSGDHQIDNGLHDNDVGMVVVGNVHPEFSDWEAAMICFGPYLFIGFFMLVNLALTHIGKLVMKLF